MAKAKQEKLNPKLKTLKEELLLAKSLEKDKKNLKKIDSLLERLDSYEKIKDKEKKEEIVSESRLALEKLKESIEHSDRFFIERIAVTQLILHVFRQKNTEGKELTTSVEEVKAIDSSTLSPRLRAIFDELHDPESESSIVAQLQWKELEKLGKEFLAAEIAISPDSDPAEDKETDEMATHIAEYAKNHPIQVAMLALLGSIFTWGAYTLFKDKKKFEGTMALSIGSVLGLVSFGHHMLKNYDFNDWVAALTGKKDIGKSFQEHINKGVEQITDLTEQGKDMVSGATDSLTKLQEEASKAMKDPKKYVEGFVTHPVPREEKSKTSTTTKEKNTPDLITSATPGFTTSSVGKRPANAPNPSDIEAPQEGREWYDNLINQAYLKGSIPKEAYYRLREEPPFSQKMFEVLGHYYIMPAVLDNTLYLVQVGAGHAVGAMAGAATVAAVHYTVDMFDASLYALNSKEKAWAFGIEAVKDAPKYVLTFFGYETLKMAKNKGIATALSSWGKNLITASWKGALWPATVPYHVVQLTKKGVEPLVKLGQSIHKGGKWVHEASKKLGGGKTTGTQKGGKKSPAPKGKPKTNVYKPQKPLKSSVTKRVIKKGVEEVSEEAVEKAIEQYAKKTCTQKGARALATSWFYKILPRKAAKKVATKAAAGLPANAVPLLGQILSAGFIAWGLWDIGSMSLEAYEKYQLLSQDDNEDKHPITTWRIDGKSEEIIKGELRKGKTVEEALKKIDSGKIYIRRRGIPGKQAWTIEKGVVTDVDIIEEN